jgi:beta-glucosidase
VILFATHLRTYRILAGWYFLGQDSGYPETNFDAWYPLDDTKNKHVNVQDDHWKVVRDIAAASIVLLKNTGDALPLKKPRSIAVIGSDAAPAARGPNGFSDRGGSDGILAMGWGSGTTNFTYLISPVEAIQARAKKDGTAIDWCFDDFNLGDAKNVARKTDTALVFIKADSGEEYLTVDGNVRFRNSFRHSKSAIKVHIIAILGRRPQELDCLGKWRQPGQRSGQRS